MRKKHTDLGVMCGIPRRNTFVLENGDVLALDKGQLYKDGKVDEAINYIEKQAKAIFYDDSEVDQFWSNN